MNLTASERAEVAEQLIASLDEAADTDVEQAWQEEVQRATASRARRSENDPVGGGPEAAATWQVNSPSRFTPKLSPNWIKIW